RGDVRHHPVPQDHREQRSHDEPDRPHPASLPLGALVAPERTSHPPLHTPVNGAATHSVTLRAPTPASRPRAPPPCRSSAGRRVRPASAPRHPRTREIHLP